MDYRVGENRELLIDVAYRFFSTKKRKFIIADIPGHETIYLEIW